MSLEFAVLNLKIIGYLSPDGCVCAVAHGLCHHRMDLIHGVKFWISNVTTAS